MSAIAGKLEKLSPKERRKALLKACRESIDQQTQLVKLAAVLLPDRIVRLLHSIVLVLESFEEEREENDDGRYHSQ